MDTASTLFYNRLEMARPIRGDNPRANRAWSLFIAAIDAVSSIPLERLHTRAPAPRAAPSAPTAPPAPAVPGRTALEEKARGLAVKVKAGEITHNQAVDELRQAAMPWAEPRSAVPTTMETATTEETIADLKHRLAKELYRLGLDLLTGGRIAGRPCDCFSKHALGLEAMAEELMTMDRDPVYAEITTWLRQREPEFTLAAVAQTEPSYYQGLAPTVRGFFKRLMGTESPGAMLT